MLCWCETDNIASPDIVKWEILPRLTCSLNRENREKIISYQLEILGKDLYIRQAFLYGYLDSFLWIWHKVDHGYSIVKLIDLVDGIYKFVDRTNNQGYYKIINNPDYCHVCESVLAILDVVIDDNLLLSLRYLFNIVPKCAETAAIVQRLLSINSTVTKEWFDDAVSMYGFIDSIKLFDIYRPLIDKNNVTALMEVISYNNRSLYKHLLKLYVKGEIDFDLDTVSARCVAYNWKLDLFHKFVDIPYSTASILQRIKMDPYSGKIEQLIDALPRNVKNELLVLTIERPDKDYRKVWNLLKDCEVPKSPTILCCPISTPLNRYKYIVESFDWSESQRQTAIDFYNSIEGHKGAASNRLKILE